MLTFISNMVGVKADKAMQAGVEALVRWDPQSASEAELRTMEQHLDDLGRQVAMARQSYDREQKEADATRRTAGLTSATSSMTVALKAMHEAAARDLASADAATAKAKLLRPTQPEHDDPNIAAALAAVSGKSPAPQSLSDRLAALKARGGA